MSNFTSGFLSGFIYLLVVFSSVSVLYIFDLFQYIKNRSFKPVMIRSSFFVSCFNGKEKYIFPFVSLLIVICIIFSVFTSGKSFDSNNKIAFPSVNAGIKSSELPNLEDYYTWDFTVRSFPYKSLNDLNNSENVKLSRFKKNEGVVTEYFEEMSFSDSYKDTVYNKIDLLSFNAFEKIMKKQGENFNAGYSSNGSHHLNLFCIIITFIQFVLILVYTFWIISNRKIRGRK
ncbi:MAG: hypothetical protein HUJ68_12125 [Clostridia bacterium]|nr:hypothetical protein [Clostridia bacterium]